MPPLPVGGGTTGGNGTGSSTGASTSGQTSVVGSGDGLSQWQRQHLSADAQARALAAANAAAASSGSSATPAQQPNLFWNGSQYVPVAQQYMWSNGQYMPYPEPMVPIAVGYQAEYGPPGARGGMGYVYIQRPLESFVDTGMAELSLGQMQILEAAAYAHMGYDISKNYANAMQQTWAYALERSVATRQDPLLVLSQIAGEGERQVSSSGGGGYYGGGGYGGGGGGGGGGATSTVTTTSLSSPSTARRLINQAMTSYLGREPTSGERQKFMNALNSAERSNPTVQEVTVSDDGTAQTQVVKQGLDVAGFTEDFAKSRPDYAEYRASTEFMQAFMDILQGPVRS